VQRGRLSEKKAERFRQMVREAMAAGGSANASRGAT